MSLQENLEARLTESKNLIDILEASFNDNDLSPFIAALKCSSHYLPEDEFLKYPYASHHEQHVRCYVYPRLRKDYYDHLRALEFGGFYIPTKTNIKAIDYLDSLIVVEN